MVKEKEIKHKKDGKVYACFWELFIKKLTIKILIKIIKMPYCEKHQIDSQHKCKKCTVEKREATMIARHGFRSALHSPEIKKKKDETCLRVYGNVVVSKTEEMKNKVKETNMRNHGVEHTLQVQEIRDKGKETMVLRYGTEHAIQNEEIKQKRVETNILRFGYENALQNPEILQKRRETNLVIYGTEEVLQSPEIQYKIRETMTEEYGAPNPLQCEEIKAKKDKTCEERYGDKDIMKNAEIFEKVAKAAFKKKEYILPSGKSVTYQGYENVALDELLETINEDDITNDVKLMPKFIYEFNNKKHRYYPDIYIPSQKRIIEVKSEYTYNKQLEQNHCKREQVIKDGYTFEFWICNKKEVIEKIGEEL